jgi:hypothetical protein
VNIYRILKSHAGLKISSPNEPDEYYPVLFLLDILVGHNEQAGSFFRSIMRGETTQPLNDLFSKPQAVSAEPAPIPLPINVILSSLEPSFLQRPIRDFRPNLELISRFSFRAIKLW